MIGRIGASLILASLASGVATQSPPVAVPAGQTAAERAAQQFIGAMNGPGSLEHFIAANFLPVSLAREDAEARAAPLERIRARSGGLTVVQSRQQGERMIEMVVATRNGGKFAKLVLFTSSRDPGKISDLFLLDARDPKRAAADAFPATPVDEGDIAALVKRRLDALAEEDRFSGAVLVGRGDRILLREARGLAEAAWAQPNTVSTRFHVGSVGKMWTAVAVLRLAEQGKLSLDDTLARWVPSYPHRSAAERITLRMLLQHRGGIGEWDGRQLGLMSSADAAATMTASPGDPDKSFAYSNAGYVLLAAAAEAASGLNFRQLIETHVFRPAGMVRSGLWNVTAIVPERATGYLRPPEDILGFGPRFANHQFLGAAADGSGGGYSTIDDLFAFHRALATGRLVKPETFKLMVDMSSEFPGAPRPSRYGLGLNLTSCSGVPTFGHGGGGPSSGVSSVTYASLDGGWTVVVLSNYDPPAAEDLASDLCELVHRR